MLTKEIETLSFYSKFSFPDKCPSINTYQYLLLSPYSQKHKYTFFKQQQLLVMLLCTFVCKKAGGSGREGIQDCALATAACRMSSPGEHPPFYASRKKGNRSGQQPEFSAQAVQHEDVIFQTAARAISEISERTKGSLRKPLEMITKPLCPAPCPRELHLLQPGTVKRVKLRY